MNQDQTIVFPIPFGFFSITCSKDAIVKTDFLRLDPLITKRCSYPLLKEAKRQVLAYFKKDLTAFDLPLKPEGSTFQRQCWELLCLIPFGETWCYSEQARKLNKPKAQRAVGGANGKNPIPLLIPCHRVIGKSGQLVGFSSGLDIKRALLAHESA